MGKIYGVWEATAEDIEKVKNKIEELGNELLRLCDCDYDSYEFERLEDKKQFYDELLDALEFYYYGKMEG